MLTATRPNSSLERNKANAGILRTDVVDPIASRPRGAPKRFYEFIFKLMYPNRGPKDLPISDNSTAFMDFANFDGFRHVRCAPYLASNGLAELSRKPEEDGYWGRRGAGITSCSLVPRHGSQS